MKQLTRRSFLQKAGIGAGATALAATLPSFVDLHQSIAEKYHGKKLNIALCGLGRYAGYLAEGIVITQYCNVAGIVTGTPAKAVYLFLFGEFLGIRFSTY